MNQQPRGFIDDAAYLEARLGLVGLRLRIEVARLRALRADGRTEQFAGVLMRDQDISALCAEMAGEGLPDMTQAEALLADAEMRFAAKTAASLAPAPMARLVTLLRLSAEEEELLALAVAPALDPRFGRVFGFLHEDMAQQGLTLGLAQRLVGGRIDALYGALAADAPLIRHGIFALRGDAPLIGKRIDVPDGIVALLIGGPGRGDQIAELPLPGAASWPDRPNLVVTVGDDDPLIGAGFAGRVWLVERGQVGLEAARIAGVAAALAGVTVAFAGWDTAPADERRALSCSLGRNAAVLTRRSALWDGHGTPWAIVHCSPQTTALRRAFWDDLTTPPLAALLADDRLTGVGALWQMAKDAVHDSEPLARIAAMIRQRRSEPMHGLADRVATPFGFDALVLPEAMKARLRAFAGRRVSGATVLEDWGLGAALGAGRGGIALFTGPSGVGKTMSAGVVARAAGLDLWRINLATVVSKYIGETEANLERIFCAAGEAEVMLFFDEAEALFSKRAEVRDARDRYANMEMSYLLQRLETFQGTAVLASNMANTLDPALLRRFDLVLDFALPDAAARRALWGKIEAAQVPLADDVDLDHIADRFDLAGGHIRQAILSAAHHAAQAGSMVTQAHLMQSVAREYANLGKTLRRDDFGANFTQVRG